MKMVLATSRPMRLRQGRRFDKNTIIIVNCCGVRLPTACLKLGFFFKNCPLYSRKSFVKQLSRGFGFARSRCLPPLVLVVTRAKRSAVLTWSLRRTSVSQKISNRQRRDTKLDLVPSPHPPR